MRHGVFITFEGIDGCGKSTQIEKAAQYLAGKNIPCLLTREPGGTPVAEKIRDLILSPENKEITDSCELLLYLAARAQHVTEKILPALENGTVVLCDRFQEATFAYQGFGRGIPLDRLQQLNEFATGGLAPDKTFIFDISVECAFERLQKMKKKPDRLENGSTEFYRKIREGYLTLASAHPQRIALLQGEKPVDEVFNEVKKEIDLLLHAE
jgi:dTMP kinase